ncbi:hypothetical protein PILCRDRAFT_10090 [Piloderma croceum F 1598]|uniref:Uncharacterized protein n=1 Tax=Piloderma croceum (strain F 1598) TaxID=765440 RepID=A0A0C3FIG0_PILCF|nr:hypothetical protein PILCRDRAFT_10090 [Piloderma croceum F 1598]
MPDPPPVPAANPAMLRSLIPAFQSHWKRTHPASVHSQWATRNEGVITCANCLKGGHTCQGPHVRCFRCERSKAKCDRIESFKHGMVLEAMPMLDAQAVDWLILHALRADANEQGYAGTDEVHLEASPLPQVETPINATIHPVSTAESAVHANPARARSGKLTVYPRLAVTNNSVPPSPSSSPTHHPLFLDTPSPTAHDSPIMHSSSSPIIPPLHFPDLNNPEISDLLGQLHDLQITMQWSPNPDVIRHLNTVNQLMRNCVMNLESELNQAVEGERHQHERVTALESERTQVDSQIDQVRLEYERLQEEHADTQALLDAWARRAQRLEAQAVDRITHLADAVQYMYSHEPTTEAWSTMAHHVERILQTDQNYTRRWMCDVSIDGDRWDILKPLASPGLTSKRKR